MNMELTQTENKSAVMNAVTNCVDVMARISTHASDKELVSAIRVLRSTNIKLLQRATQLEQTLVECRKQLQTQQARSHDSQNMQKMPELISAQEQIKLLKQELASHRQTVQQQQMIIEGLSVQLHASQERVDQTEQEWLLAQASYNQQSQQLRQTENNCQELRNRLNRQLQHNVQLKIALDKCHELTSVGDESKSASESVFGYSDSDKNTIARQVFPPAQPIPPWSVPSAASPPQDLVEPLETKPEQTHYNLAGEEALIATFSEQFPEAVSTFGQTAEEQHDAVWELLNEASFATDSTPQTTIEIIEIQSVATSQVEIKQPNLPHLQTSTPDSESNVIEPQPIQTEYQSVAAATPPQAADKEQWEDAEFFIPNPNWPSPVVYPARTKKRRSLATIELPKFVHS